MFYSPSKISGLYYLPSLLYFQPKIGLANVEGYYYDGVLYCSFIRQKSLPQVPGFFDLEQDWHIMFAHGKVLQVPGTITLICFTVVFYLLLS